jgi:2C-methyl-D-erythritol 2,4-cyclodiphosphate synthase
MSKNSTLKMWNHLLKEEYTLFDKSVHSIISKNKIGPKRETIDTILAYASSVKAIRIKSKDKILISLN